MNANLSRVLAVLEVIAVAFFLRLLLVVGMDRAFPGFEAWQTAALGFPFPVSGHVVMAGLAVAAILLRGKSLEVYGISFKNPGYHLSIAGACFIPFVLAGMPIGMGVDYKSWGGAFILAAVQAGLLFVLALILRKKPDAPALIPATAGAAGPLVGVLFGLPAVNAAAAGGVAGQALTVFLTYALFVGFGEEILYRGYMHSRLSEAFGKPYRFLGVPYGWGGILAAVLFGLSHAGLLGWLFGLSEGVTLAWGFWNIFAGLVFGLVREKSGSILAPALLHGLPQAIAMAVMVFL